MVCTIGGYSLWWYGRSNVIVDIGLRNALLKRVLESHVYPVDILCLWDIATGIDEVYIYQRIYGFIRSRLVVTGGRDELDRNDPLFVDEGGPFALVEGLLILRTELVQETIHMVSRGRNDIRVASLVNDPTPVKTMNEMISIGRKNCTSRVAVQSRCICSLGSAGSSDLSTSCYRNRNRWSVQYFGPQHRQTVM